MNQHGSLIIYNTEEWQVEWAWLADPQRTIHPQSGHLSTIDRAQRMESLPTS